MKKIITLVAVLALAVGSAFALPAFKFNESGFIETEDNFQSYYGTGFCGHKWLLQYYNISLDGYEEITLDSEAYSVLYWINKDSDWSIIVADQYIGTKTKQQFWTEYHLYKKIGL